MAIAALVFMQSFKAFADAVYLKNGTVMTGRIVEKTPEYIVLKTSEDEDAARVTVFLEDIYKVEEQGEFVEKLRFIPYDLRRGFSERGFTAGSEAAGLLSKEEGNLAQIKSLLSQDRQYKTELAEKKAKEDLRAAQMKDKEGISGPRQEGKYTASGQLKGRAEQQRSKAPKTGDGIISGDVVLPDISYAKRMKGNLYIYLMEDLDNGQFIFNEDMPFVKVSYRGIVSRKVSYSIKHVPAGRYKVMAQWDVKYPFIKEKDTVSGKKSLSYLGAKGDYSGECYEAVALKPDEKREGVTFNCDRLIQEDQFSFGLDKRPSVDVKDIYYQKLPFQEGKIILFVENNTDDYISLAAFDILINDEKLLSLPFELNGMEPHSGKEFDITYIYRLYLGQGLGKPGEPVTVKILWLASGEVALEKVVRVF